MNLLVAVLWNQPIWTTIVFEATPYPERDCYYQLLNRFPASHQNQPSSTILQGRKHNMQQDFPTKMIALQHYILLSICAFHIQTFPVASARNELKTLDCRRNKCNDSIIQRHQRCRFQTWCISSNCWTLIPSSLSYLSVIYDDIQTPT